MDPCVVSTMVNRAAVNVYAPPAWHMQMINTFFGLRQVHLMSVVV